MKTKLTLKPLCFCLLLSALCLSAHGQVPGIINYQGRVAVGAANFDGAGQFKFALVNGSGNASYWSNDGSSAAGSQPGTAVALTVTKGLYSVLLGDTNLPHMTAAVPPSAFTNADVRLRVWFNDGTNGFQLLIPDQRLGAVGYALAAGVVPNGSINSNAIAAGAVGTAQLASGSVTAATIAAGQVVKSLDGLTDAVTLAAGTNVTLSTNANTLTISAANGWRLTGNAGTTAGVNFIGTTDNQPLELRVGGTRAMRLEPNVQGPNVIGGAPVNSVASGVFAATISGGIGNTATNNYTTVSGGENNAANGFLSTVGGGQNNLANGTVSTVSGGNFNSASSGHATVGGGGNNTANGDSATVGGGVGNNANGANATVGGGGNNRANGDSATVGGGVGNNANGTNATVGGGNGNIVQTNASYSTIGGGNNNSASGTASTVPGGSQNTASGAYSFAAGLSAQATNTGAFVWSDGSSGAPFPSTAANQFSIRAIGGVRLVTGGAGLTLDGQAVGTTNVLWQLRGNAGTAAGTNFLGTTDNQPLEFKVNNQRALRLEPNTKGAPNMIAGSLLNSVSNGVIGATISGGGATNYNGLPHTNTVAADFGTVSGGYNNTASALGATVGGGYGNTASGFDSTVGGGDGNTASSTHAVVGGGFNNTASGFASTVAGGGFNVASSDYCFAAGAGAQALHYGSFVWKDDSAGTFASTTPNQFSVFASGGVRLIGDVQIGDGEYRHLQMGGGNSTGFLYGAYNPLGDGIHLGYNFYYDAGGAPHVINAGGGTSRITAGYGEIVLAVGGVNSAPLTTMLHVTTAGVCVNGAISPCSDRSVKQDFAPVSPSEILDKVTRLPVSEWSYKTDSATRHIGVMAQDFYAAFNVGADDKHIATVDEEGVALAAIQGLNQKVEELKTELNRRDAENLELKRRLASLELVVRSRTAK